MNDVYGCFIDEAISLTHFVCKYITNSGHITAYITSWIKVGKKKLFQTYSTTLTY